MRMLYLNLQSLYIFESTRMVPGSRFSVQGLKSDKQGFIFTSILPPVMIV